MTSVSTRPWARLGLSGLAVFMFSPVVLHGLWRPLAQVLHAETNALSLTFASFCVAAVAWVVAVATVERGPKNGLPRIAAGLAAPLFGLLFGRGFASVAAASLALFAVALFAGSLVPFLVSRLPSDMETLAKRRYVVTTLVVLVGLLAIVQFGRLSTFMGDSTRTEMSAFPGERFFEHHSCLTAYVEASRLAKEGATNVYDAENWPDLSHSARSAAYQVPYAPFDLDAFAYPPPFLLLPRFLLLPLGDFASQRALWFGLNSLLLAIGLWTVAAWIGGRTQVRALLLAPLVLLTFPVFISLQIGNVHSSVIVLSVLGMIAFERERPALGGALLAFAIASKISPGLLVILLLARRRYREVLWTAGFGICYVGLCLLVFGVAPIKAFLVYQMPLLSTGEALRFLALPQSVPFNMGPFGIPFKLDMLGVHFADLWKTAKHLNEVFTVLVVLLSFMAARKEGGPRIRAELWLTILTLGTLRSPYAPGYVSFPLFWLFSLLSTEVRGKRTVALMTAAWLIMAFTPPFPQKVLMLYSLTQQFVLLGLLIYSVLRKPTPEALLIGPLDRPAD